jgi:hypothetical protein
MSRDSDTSGWIVAVNAGGGEFRWRRGSDGVQAEWVGILTLEVHPDGRVVTNAVPGTNPLLADKVLHAGAAAFLRALEGRPSLHGSAVCRSGSAWACLGESGAGKSTAAAELCRRHGFELLADDAVGLERIEGGWRVLPTESAHWLAALPGARKTRVPTPARAGGPVPLNGLVYLRFDETAPDIALRQLTGARKYGALAASAMRFERTEASCRSELDVLASLAEHAAVYELTRGPQSSSADTADAIAALVSALVSAG